MFGEDDRQFAEVVAEMLQRGKGGAHQVEQAVALQDAPRLLDQDDFDVALVDLYLPDSEGLDTVRRLRKRSPVLPIVILTGRKEAELARNALRFWAQDFLEKTELLPSLLVRVISYAIQRRQAELRLAESEKRYRQLVEQMKDVIYRLDQSAHIIYISPSVEELLGLRRESLLGQEVTAPTRPSHRQQMRSELQRHLEGRSPAIHILAPGPKDKEDGGAIWLDYPLWSEGHLLGLQGIARDVTELKRARDELEASQRELEERVRRRTRQLEAAKQEWERTFDAVPDLIAIIDPDYRLVRINRAFARRLGQEPQDLIGRHCYEVIHGSDSEQKIEFVPPEALEETREKIRYMRQGHPVTRFETVRLTKDGRRLNVELNTSPLYHDEGNHIGNIVVMRDITAVKEAEAARRETEERFPNLGETMNEGPTILTQTVRFNTASPSSARRWVINARR